MAKKEDAPAKTEKRSAEVGAPERPWWDLPLLPDVRRWFDWPEFMRLGRPGEGFGMIRVEEREEADAHVVRAEMPGIDPERDVEISVANGLLTIRAERREKKEEKGKGMTRSEFRYGSFTRTLPLPPGASDKDVAATYQDGILEVRVPVSREEAGATKIPITRL